MSKIVRFELGGEAAAGDVVNLGYSARAGGLTLAGHLVMPGESLADVATGLAGAVNSHWCAGLFNAQAIGTTILVICERGAEDINPSFLVEHVVGAEPWVRAPGGSATVTIA